MKHHKAGVPRDVGPRMIVSRRIAKLIHDEVVRSAMMLPDKVVSARGIVEIDVIASPEAGHDFSRVRGNTRAGRCKR